MPSTEQILKVLENERECIKRQIGITAPDGSIGICDRNCAECDLCLPDDEILEVYNYLIGLISIGVFEEHSEKTEKPTKDLINEIAGFDVTLMPKLPETRRLNRRCVKKMKLMERKQYSLVGITKGGARVVCQNTDAR